MSRIRLEGCRPAPMSDYLKGLGVFRLISTQLDRDALAHWDEGTLVIDCDHDAESIIDWFIDDYCPSPIMDPWNNSSGFWPSDKDNCHSTVDNISNSVSERLSLYRDSISTVRSIVDSIGMDSVPTTEPAKSDIKNRIVRACRSRLTDEYVKWMDSSLFVTGSDIKFPPILGTGGNDGRLDFCMNFMQRLNDVIDVDGSVDILSSKALLGASMMGTTTNALSKSAIGQFAPSRVGGVNSSSGLTGNSVVNPWDYILTIEGCLTFSSTITRRFDGATNGLLSYPFSVRPSALGYSSSNDSDESTARAEIWLPTWDNPTSYREIESLYKEGRVTVNGRSARNGVDFSRAISSLGVDRGVEAFTRFSLMQRNGKAYFATQVGSYPVRNMRAADLLSEIDPWLERFRSKVRAETAPSSMRLALRALESSIMGATQSQSASAMTGILISLGKLEASMSSSPTWVKKSNVPPLPLISTEWLSEAYDGTAEFRLASALASVYGRYMVDVRGKRSPMYVPMRRSLEPVGISRNGGSRRPFWLKEDTEAVWSMGDPICSMNRALLKRAVMRPTDGCKLSPDRGMIHAPLEDVRAFQSGAIDLRRFEDLLWGTTLIDWPGMRGSPPWHSMRPRSDPVLPYASMKLCLDPRSSDSMCLHRDIFRYAVVGDMYSSTRRALMVLRADGYAVRARPMKESPHRTMVIAASLLFPIDDRSMDALKGMIDPEHDEGGEQDGIRGIDE